MTKEQYINFWIDTAQNDWVAVVYGFWKNLRLIWEKKR
jgi:hypothetical protein